MASNSISGNVVSITGYASGTPDDSGTVYSVASQVGLSGLTNEYLVFHGFVKVVAQRLNPTDNPSGWGLLSKSPGETQVDGFAVDAIIYGGTQEVVDIVNGAGGASPSPSWQTNQPKRPNNNWAAPSSAGPATGSTTPPSTQTPAPTPGTLGTQTPTSVLYCKSDGSFGTLGNTCGNGKADPGEQCGEPGLSCSSGTCVTTTCRCSTTPGPGPGPGGTPPPNPTIDRDACIKAGFAWTGSKCCGEPEDRPEYYNDLTTSAGGKTGTGSCDAPAGTAKYTNQVDAAISSYLASNTAIANTPNSDQNAVFTFLEGVAAEIKRQNSGFSASGNVKNCNGNRGSDGLIVGGASDNYGEYYDLIGSQGSGASIGSSAQALFIELADWKRCNCGRTTTTTQNAPSTPTTSGPSGLGGCWNSEAVMSIGFVHGSKNSIGNYNGQFYGCALDKDNYNTENNAALSLKDAFTHGALVINLPYCSASPENSYYCSYTEKWEATNGQNKSHFSTSPLPNASQKSECCAATECWDGQACIENQKNKPLSGVLGNGYRCIDGEWKQMTQKCTPEGSACGYCPEETQCLLNPLGNSSNSQCINSSEYSNDDYCENGQWSSRTKLVALKLLSLRSADYILFCDNKENTLNNLNYLTNSGQAAAAVLTSLQTNNFCVLKNNNQIIIGTSINKPLENVTGGFNILGVTSCPNAKEDGNYYSCDSSNNVWYNKQLKSFIYSSTPVALTSAQEPTSYLTSIIKSIIDAIKRLIINPPFDESYVNSIKKFDKIYLAQQGGKSIRGALEGNNIKNAVLEYNSFDMDICAYIISFNSAQQFTLSGVSCAREVTNYYVLAQGSKLTSLDPESIWPDLTSKLRIK